ncbi:hypothetical protein EG68_01340 [Paragonimus skrjabini miyazakii]|uniref:Ankyrin repeat domain-containing protein 42 n=1 Tax=Paragonimus skrjabini miyazakii TaxID=59628 RepID=A0A8S9Z1P1_9TREM|nr:hypothetical protein EG68_01340 [Paragonimus skrjabini miyazakii]
MFRPGEKATIHTAVKRADLADLEQMLASGANINEIDNMSFSPLHWAANVGAIEILQFLLWNKADPTIVSDRGWTPVHIAAIRGYEACIQSLADRGVSLSAQDHHGFTPGHLAAVHGNSSCLLALLRLGADVETANQHGWTMLHCAAFHGRLGCVQVLLRWGFRIEDVDKQGNTAAHLAAMEGHLPVLQCLVSQARTPIYLLDTPNDNGDTPETLARRFLKEDVLTYVEKVKAERRDHSHNADMFALLAFPAHTAAYKGDLEHLQALVDGGVIKIDERDEQGSTPLHKAAGQGQIKIIHWLCENGADPSIRNQLGERPADVARRYGQLAALDLLKSHHLSEKEEESWLEQSALSDIPFSYVEGEPEPGLLYDKEAAIGRARRKVEKMKKLLDLAKSDYKQLGGEPSPEEVRVQEEFREVN